MSTLKQQQYASVWDALEDTPDAAENMRIRSELMRSLASFIEESNLNQAQAARLLGVTQPRISDLVRGKIGLFGLDALFGMAARAGFRVQVRLWQSTNGAPYYSPDTDVSSALPAASPASAA